MDTRLLLKVLGRRRELAARDGWSPSQVRTYQARRLAALRDHSQLRSRFYREFHRGLTRAPLAELPILTKAVLMDRFDDLITRGDLRLADARAHLAAGAGAQRLMGRYYVAATAGTTGEPGIFVWDVEEWAEVLASYSRAYGWAGASVRLTGRTRMAVVSSTVPSHQSALVGAASTAGSSRHCGSTPGIRSRTSSGGSTTSGPTFWWVTPACWGCWRGSSEQGACTCSRGPCSARRRC